MKNIKNYIAQYRKYLVEQAKSENTIKTYIGDVEQFNRKFDYLTRENILKYKKMIVGSSKTINRKLSSLKSFNEFLLEEGIVPVIYIKKADYPKLQSIGNPTKVTEQQVDNFLENVDNIECTFKIRNSAIVYLITATGIRRSEVSNLLLRNLNLDKKELVVIGKGNKERTVFIDDEEAIKLLKEYLKEREKSIFHNSKYIFVSNRSKKLHECSINKIFNKYETENCKVNPHALRHNFASEIVEKDIIPLSSLQNLLGHSSIATTGLYVHPRQESIKKNIGKLQIGKRHKKNIG